MTEKSVPFSVTILPTKIWIESGMFGEKVVVLQNEGWEPFDYAIFNYNYAYTDNSGTLAAATKLALELGGIEPFECRPRELAWDTSTPKPPIGAQE